jgi:4-hydroxythreonine-4-phosphate dehydrogenase
MDTLRIALTTGEPAGIGPDLTVQLAQDAQAHEVVAIGDPGLFSRRAQLLQLPLKIRPFEGSAAACGSAAGELTVLPLPLGGPCNAGQLDTINAPYVLDTLQTAVDGCQQGLFHAMVTAPVQKSVINDAGVAFTGHTEFLADRTDCPTVVMLLACEKMRVALTTTHLPLSAVAPAITRERIESVLTILHRDLQSRFGLKDPVIAVLGLNPHAGESGHMGREEIEIINPTLERLRRRGFRLLGALPADTAFNPGVLTQVDAVLAMYHDQGLPVLKYASFGHAANITLGLPIIRTSVDHGTALDLAGRGGADAGSLRYALDAAISMASTGVSSP